MDFNEVFAEEEHTKTYNQIHEAQAALYTYSKFLLYNTLSIVCGIPFSIFWGLFNAVLIFFVVWIGYPVYKLLYVLIWPGVHFLYVIVFAPFLEPCMDTMGRCMRHAQVHVSMTDDRRNRNRNED